MSDPLCGLELVLHLSGDYQSQCRNMVNVHRDFTLFAAHIHTLPHHTSHVTLGPKASSLPCLEHMTATVTRCSNVLQLQDSI